MLVKKNAVSLFRQIFKTENKSATLCHHLKRRNRIEHTNKTCRKFPFSTPTLEVFSLSGVQINHIAI